MQSIRWSSKAHDIYTCICNTLVYCIILFAYRHGEYVIVNGTEMLESQGFRVDWLWYDQIGLAGLCLLFLTLGYITLRAIKKEK